MQTSKEKRIQRENIKISKEMRINYEVRHPETIPKKAREEFKRVPKY